MSRIYYQLCYANILTDLYTNVKNKNPENKGFLLVFHS